MSKYRIKRIDNKYYPQKRFCLFFWLYFYYHSFDILTFNIKHATFGRSLNECQNFISAIKQKEYNKKPIVQIYPYD